MLLPCIDDGMPNKVVVAVVHDDDDDEDDDDDDDDDDAGNRPAGFLFGWVKRKETEKSKACQNYKFFTPPASVFYPKNLCSIWFSLIYFFLLA